MSTISRDINDLFDDIVLAEERLNQRGYKEGEKVGCIQGIKEGYQLGYSKGVHLGAELGGMYADVALKQTQHHSQKVHRAFEQLRQGLDHFPRDNNPTVDIIGEVEKLRSIYKRVQVLTTTKAGREQVVEGGKPECKEFSF